MCLLSLELVRPLSRFIVPARMELVPARTVESWQRVRANEIGKLRTARRTVKVVAEIIEQSIIALHVLPNLDGQGTQL